MSARTHLPRPARLAAAAAAAPILALAVAGTAAHAQEDPGSMTGSITFTPRTVRPGGELDVRTGDCDTASGTATSDAFTGPARLGPAADGGVFATAHIRGHAAPGRYAVTVVCGHGTAEGSFTVAAARPSGPVHAGGGALADRPADEQNNLGPATVTGAVLVLGGAAALIVMEARRRRSRRG